MRLTVGDLGLNVELAGEGRPLLLLHGFMGSTATWRPLQGVLSRCWRVIAVDLIGHGCSDAPADPGRYTMERCVADLLAVLDTLGIEQTALLGYSMGGRVGLHLAAAAPERISALVLESASPGLATAEERRVRLHNDELVARRIEDDGLLAFVEYWEGLPLFASQAALPAGTRAALHTQRLQNNPRGLANSLRGMGTGGQQPLWDHLASLDMPVLLIAGELDSKYCALAGAMGGAIPGARLVLVPDAGHAVHLEQPGAFGQTVRAFLEQHQ